MFNVLLDSLPQEWEGYPVDMAFETGIKISQCLIDEDLDERERIIVALSLMFPKGVNLNGKKADEASAVVDKYVFSFRALNRSGPDGYVFLSADQYDYGASVSFDFGYSYWNADRIYCTGCIKIIEEKCQDLTLPEKSGFFNTMKKTSLLRPFCLNNEVSVFKQDNSFSIFLCSCDMHITAAEHEVNMSH